MKKEFNYKFSSQEKNCDNNVFTLASHQEFVKRFINYNTSYNGLLLFHGLGSGKTCSAIGITEETRKYIKFNKEFKQILIVASPNVQENFKLQLFDENKLEYNNNRWIIRGCLGSSLLQELNIENDVLIKKEEIIKKVNRLIKKYYKFLGYIEFANIIEKIVDGNIIKNKNKLKDEFKNRMIVIDEIHNIRTEKEINNDEVIIEDSIDLQKVAKYLDTLVKNVKYMKLILLTGTPMFNNVKEIVYILNILRQNDKYKMIKSNEIFDKEGYILKDGKDKLFELSNGYISYVRGENPYTFPFLFYPETFNIQNSIKSMEYPRFQFNQIEITIPIKYLDIYTTNLNSGLQYYAYTNEIENIKKENEKIFDNMKKINYHKINRPLQSLNIVYETTDDKNDYLLGKEGIKYTFDYKVSGTPPVAHSFEYKNNKDMFTYDTIEKYSVKIKLILDSIRNSKGIILIYSQWLDSGLIPMALALEEEGFSRYGDKTKNLINNKKNKYSYSIICGDKKYSPDNNKEIYGLTNKNVNGEKVKVVLISQAGTEGIDLKNIRQVHIMEPWYNMNRIEQIIGRARRQCSHKELPLNERNVQVFLHGTILKDNKTESLDLYLYRNNEEKSIQIGSVNRLLKMNSVDCLLNIEQTNFSKINMKVTQTLSNDKVIKDYDIKDKEFTNICDYNKDCEYYCRNTIDKTDYGKDNTTYKYSHSYNNYVIEEIKSLFLLKHVYTINVIKTLLKKKNNLIKEEDIENSIDYLNNSIIIDKNGKKGSIIKIDELLVFQPGDHDYTFLSTEERINPIHRTKYFKIKEIINKKKDFDVNKFIELYTTTLKIINEHEILNQMIEDDIFETRDISYIKEKISFLLLDSMIERLVINEHKKLLEDVLNDKTDEIKKKIYEIYNKYYIIDNLVLLLDSKNDKEKEGILNLYQIDNKKIEDTLDDDYTKFKLLYKDNRKKNKFIGYISEVGQKKIKKTEFKIETKHFIEKENYLEILRSIVEDEFYLDKIKSYRTYHDKNNFNLILELLMRYKDIHDKNERFFLRRNERFLNKN